MHLKKETNMMLSHINEETISNLKIGKTKIIAGSEEEISSVLKDKIIIIMRIYQIEIT